VLTVVMNGGPKSFCFRPLRVAGAPGARAGPGRVRGRRPWASGGGAVTGGAGGRLGVAAALRAGGGSVPVSGPGGPAVGVLGAAAVRGFGTPGADSGGGFAARARTAGHCSSFYDGPAVADDPVARRRRPPARGECDGTRGIDMVRPKLEIADIFRRHGEAWRSANVGHINRTQRRVMKAIELCRTAKLGGHVERCQECEHTRVAYNSCRNRHCAKCQWQSASAWLAAREAELLPVPYFHLVFRLPTALGRVAYQNKTIVYGLLLKAAAEALTIIAADPMYLGADIGITAVLHTWGQNLHQNPHSRYRALSSP
jgi:Transposase zinc-binding domain